MYLIITFMYVSAYVHVYVFPDILVFIYLIALRLEISITKFGFLKPKREIAFPQKL